jgi:hypothetical protein
LNKGGGYLDFCFFSRIIIESDFQYQKDGNI